MRIRRRHAFSAPVVVTVALAPACGGAPAGKVPAEAPRPLSVTVVPPPPGQPPPEPPARPEPPPFTVGSIVFRDPVCYRVTGDDPAAWTPEACPLDLLPPAPTDQLVILTSDADPPWCFVVRPTPADSRRWDEGRVRCPDSGPTAILPDRRDFTEARVRITLDERSLGCLREVAGNPPHLEPIDRCPPALLPWLAEGVSPTRTDGDACYWHDVEVSCTHGPVPPPVPPPATIAAHIVVTDVQDDGRAIVTLDRGGEDGIDPRWIGELTDRRGRVLVQFVVVKVRKHDSIAVIEGMKRSAIAKAQVRLVRPPP